MMFGDSPRSTPLPTTTIRGRFLNAALAAVAVVLALSVTEVGLRSFYPPPTGYFVLVPGTDRIVESSPALMPGVEGTARYRVNEHGIRGRPFGDDGSEVRILALGGSATECAYLDEDEVWTALLERRLGRSPGGRRAWVGNIGRSGRTARDHAVQLTYVLRQPPPIDVALVLVGANDLLFALAQGDAYERPAPITDPDAERAQLRRAFVLLPGPIHRPPAVPGDAPWHERTVLWQLARRVKLAWEARTSVARQDERGATITQWRAARAAGATIDRLPARFAAMLAEYQRNLEAMVAAAAEARVELVLVTQPSLWRADNTEAERARLWMGGVGSYPATPARAYYSTAVLAEGMHAYNDVLLEVCRTNGLTCVDAAGVLPQDTRILYDDVHFTEEGSRRIAALLAEVIGAW
jgi:lysophospholipase L1-like esterase